MISHLNSKSLVTLSLRDVVTGLAPWKFSMNEPLFTRCADSRLMIPFFVCFKQTSNRYNKTKIKNSSARAEKKATSAGSTLR